MVVYFILIYISDLFGLSAWGGVGVAVVGIACVLRCITWASPVCLVYLVVWLLVWYV